MSNCYLCGSPADLPLLLKDTFTAHSLSRCPESDKMCQRCDYWLNLRCWYFNPNKQKWGKLFARNWSSLFVQGSLVSPVIQGSRTEDKDTLPIVSKLPTRAEIREWLINPPDPPFVICIAESGQKHIIPWAQTGYNTERFPVQFELDCVWVNKTQFAELLADYEALMALGFSKTEIDSGDYHSDRLMQVFRSGSLWTNHEERLQHYRGSRLLALLSYVAQKRDP